MEIKDLEHVVELPGVYMWKDVYNNILYIGKAANLRKRMIQYLRGYLHSHKTAAMIREIHSYEVLICNSVKEALILERNLIRQHSPPYNILLLDDKRFPYIRISYERNKFDIDISYRVTRSKNTHYFGPFPSGYGARTLAALLKRETSYREGLPITDESKDYWDRQYQWVREILGYKNVNYLRLLERRMEAAAEELNFEIANDYKLAIEYLRKIKEEQTVELQNDDDLDFIVADTYEEHVFITLFFYRMGILVSKQQVIFPQRNDLANDVEVFLSNFYTNHPLPKSLFMDSNLATIEEIFYQNVRVYHPTQGIYKRILDIATTNNAFARSERLQEFKQRSGRISIALDQLRVATHLARVDHLVMFDNSVTPSTDPVSVAIVYRNGIRSRSEYRRYYIRDLIGPRGDIEHLRQGLQRYLEANTNLPNAIFVDGGMQQVRATRAVLAHAQVDLPVVGLVKNEAHQTKGLIDIHGDYTEDIPRELMNFLRGMQIEVDKYAKSTHSRRALRSITDGLLRSISGIGAHTEAQLLQHFGDYHAIYNATIEELSKVVSPKLAQKIYEFFR